MPALPTVGQGQRNDHSQRPFHASTKGAGEARKIRGMLPIYLQQLCMPTQNQPCASKTHAAPAPHHPPVPLWLRLLSACRQWALVPGHVSVSVSVKCLKMVHAVIMLATGQCLSLCSGSSSLQLMRFPVQAGQWASVGPRFFPDVRAGSTLRPLPHMQYQHLHGPHVH